MVGFVVFERGFGASLPGLAIAVLHGHDLLEVSRE